MTLFEGENMQTQYNVLGYRIDLYFHDYKLAIEIDENGLTWWKWVIEQELGCRFIRTDPDKAYFNIFRAINQIFRHIKQSTKKIVINKISKRLLGLELENQII